MVWNRDPKKIAQLAVNDAENDTQRLVIDALPSFVRLEIPIKDRYLLREYAEILQHLSLRFAAISHDHRYRDSSALLEAMMEVKAATQKMKRLAQKT